MRIRCALGLSSSVIQLSSALAALAILGWLRSASATSDPQQHVRVDDPASASEPVRLSVRALLEAGHRALAAGAYTEAEGRLRAALGLAESGLGAADLDTARALNQLGMLAKY